jgi:hypothetical protein
VDVNWAHGTLITPPTPAEPKGEGIAELLDEAEEIINAAGPSILAEVQREDAKKRTGWRKIFRRKR